MGDKSDRVESGRPRSGQFWVEGHFQPNVGYFDETSVIIPKVLDQDYKYPREISELGWLSKVTGPKVADIKAANLFVTSDRALVFFLDNMGQFTLALKFV